VALPHRRLSERAGVREGRLLEHRPG
jgi:hypothetical protein